MNASEWLALIVGLVAVVAVIVYGVVLYARFSARRVNGTQPKPASERKL